MVLSICGCNKSENQSIATVQTTDISKEEVAEDTATLKLISNESSLTVELTENEALSAFFGIDSGKAILEIQIMSNNPTVTIASYEYDHSKDWQPEFMTFDGEYQLYSSSDTSAFEAKVSRDLFWMKVYTQVDVSTANEILLLVMDDSGQSLYEKRYYQDLHDDKCFVIVNDETADALELVWPVGLPRYEKDSEFFSPITDDFAYFAHDIDGVVVPGANPAAVLLSFDEYGEIVQCVERITADSSCSGKEEIITAVNEFEEFCYIEYSEFHRKYSDFGKGRVESYYNSKAHLLQVGIDYLGVYAYSIPYLQQIKIKNICDVSDISLLSYFPDLPEDYFVNVWGYQGDTQFALILEFDDNGVIKNRYAMMQFFGDTTPLMQKAQGDDFTVLSETDSVVMKKGYYFEEAENYPGATKDGLMLSFANNYEYTKGLSYKQLREENINVMYFSQPYLSNSIMNNINTAYTEGKWSTVIAFEEMYPDRVTYTLENFTRDEPLTQIQWVIAYENGKAVAAYTRYDTLPGEAYRYSNILVGSTKVYDDKNLIFNMENNFAGLPLYGQSKDEVLRLIKADCKNVGCELVSVN